VAELALDYIERNSLAREFDRVSIAQLVRREPAPDAGLYGETTELAARRSARPRPAARPPSITQNSGPIGSSTRATEPRPQLLPAAGIHTDLASISQAR
jgi:hypothetical protein